MAIKIKKTGEFRTFQGSTYETTVHKNSIIYQYDSKDDELRVTTLGTEISSSQALGNFTKETDEAFADFNDFLTYMN